jgi:acetyl/propionyl-CoA carboxylase alpha subunit
MGLGREDRHISSVLVANRGEIAVRVIRACHELGMEAIGIYGEGDEYGLHVTLANRAFRIPEGNGMPYLRGDAIIQLARDAGADAIHPGYGFLAENGDFAKSVTEAGFIFIGPMPETIRQMGDKVRARQIAADAGIAAIPSR